MKNRLKHVIASGGEAIYTYDYLGRRIRTNNNGTITNCIYDGDRVIAEYDNSGSLICEYVYGNSIDEVLYMIKGSDFYYYHYDGLGSARAITDSSEAVVETYTYDVYGKPTLYDNQQQEITTSSIGNRFYFSGREHDFTSELYYYRARYYNPALGRFMSPDPVGLAMGPNLYTYCENNPLNLSDPMGLFGGKMTLRAKVTLWSDYIRRKYVPDFSRARKIAEELLATNQGHNDLEDAMRHAEWSRRMAEEINQLTSYLAGVGHEIENLFQGSPLNETRMDLHNNAEGRAATREGRPIDLENLATSPDNIGGLY